MHFIQLYIFLMHISNEIYFTKFYINYRDHINWTHSIKSREKKIDLVFLNNTNLKKLEKDMIDGTN